MQTIESNRLNGMLGSDWLPFTKTWFVYNPPPRKSKFIHPATFPDGLAEDFIQFFTKPNDWVLDPFAGSGSALVAARRLHRNSLGIELYPDFSELARKRICEVPSNMKNIVFPGDCREILPELKKEWQQKIDFCITSPPYWCQLGNNNERNEERKFQGLKTLYGVDKRDLGNMEDYNKFLNEQELVFSQIDELMKLRSYIVVITNNVYRDGKLYPLAFDTFNSMCKFWVPKDEKIWCQDNKKLYPFGMFHSYIGNRSHHYCLIFRKEKG